MMLENTRAGIQGPDSSFFPPKLNAALAHRQITELGAVDVLSVERCYGAVRVRVCGRGNPAVDATFEVLPMTAGELVAQTPRLLAGVPENRKAPVPEAIPEGEREITHDALGETGFYQIAPGVHGFEMAWLAIESPRAIRAIVTTGQIEALARDVGAVLATFTDEDRRARIIDCRTMGGARQLREPDGDLPVGAFVQLTTPEKLSGRHAPGLVRVRARLSPGVAQIGGADVAVVALGIYPTAQIDVLMIANVIGDEAPIHRAWIVVVAIGVALTGGHACCACHPGGIGSTGGTTLRGGSTLPFRAGLPAAAGHAGDRSAPRLATRARGEPPAPEPRAAGRRLPSTAALTARTGGASGAPRQGGSSDAARAARAARPRRAPEQQIPSIAAGPVGCRTRRRRPILEGAATARSQQEKEDRSFHGLSSPLPTHDDGGLLPAQMFSPSPTRAMPRTSPARRR